MFGFIVKTMDVYAGWELPTVKLFRQDQRRLDIIKYVGNSLGRESRIQRDIDCAYSKNCQEADDKIRIALHESKQRHSTIDSTHQKLPRKLACFFLELCE